MTISTGAVRTLTDTVAGTALIGCNNGAVANDGTVYFSDFSVEYETLLLTMSRTSLLRSPRRYERSLYATQGGSFRTRTVERRMSRSSCAAHEDLIRRSDDSRVRAPRVDPQSGTNTRWCSVTCALGGRPPRP